MRKDIIVSYLGLLGTSALLVTACTSEPKPEQQQMRGIASLATPTGDTYAKAGDTIRTVRVTRTITYDSTYILPFKGTTTPPVVVEPEPVKGYELTISNGFDKRTDIENSETMQMANGIIATDKYVTGPGSFLSIPANVSNGTRSEVQYSQRNTPTEGAVEYDVYYDVFIPSNGHSLQFHPVTTGGSASPGLWHIGGYNVTVMRWKAGRNTPGKTWAMPQKKWVKLRFEYKFANSYAYYRIYIDGVLKDEMQPTSTSWLGDGSGQWLKVGYNGWDASSPKSRIYYDNLKIYNKL